MEVTSFTLICVIILAIDGAITSDRSKDINAKSGSNATLLCPWTDDSVKWYGIYGHQYSSGKSILSSLPASLQERLDIWEKDGYNLRIKNVSKYDEGNYQCSSINGTKYTRMFLIAPPTDVIFENLVQNYIKGSEDTTLNITCKGVGGHPPPSLILLQNDTILATADNGTIVYTMQPSRIDDGSNFSCIANHSELEKPFTAESILYLNLKTEKVTMESIPTLYEFDVLNASCSAIGGRPPTSFEWNLLGEYYNSSHEDVENIRPTDTYNVKSVLSVEVFRSFNKRKLSCRAFDSINEDGTTIFQTLEVYYAPSINISYQNMTTEDNIRQLNCQPQGNPVIYKFYQWEHHSAYGEKIRTLSSGLNGVLQIPELDSKQRYQDTGIYKCFAENGIVGKDGNKTQSGSVYFVNEGRPKLSIYNPSEQFCKLGSVGSIVVKFTSWPPPLNLTWLKYESNRNFNLQASERYTMTETAAVIIDSFHDKKIHVDGYIGILHINEVALKDLTNYTVQIQNEFGIESFAFILNDIPKDQDYETGSDQGKSLFYGGPAVILTIVFITAVVIALIVWRKRSHCKFFRSIQKAYDKRDNDIEGSISEDVAVYSSSNHKRKNLQHGNQNQKPSDEMEIYNEGTGYTYPEENTRISNQQPESAINVRSTRGGTVKKQLRQPSPDIESESDDSGEIYTDGELTPPIPPRSTDVHKVKVEIPVHKVKVELPVHEVKVEIIKTCSFVAENEGYIPEENSSRTRRRPPPILLDYEDFEKTVRTRRLPPPIPDEVNDCIEDERRERSSPPINEGYDDYNGIVDGSLPLSDKHGPMSSKPYASYSGNVNEASASISQPTGIRHDKHPYSDHYNCMSHGMDFWTEPLTATKTLDSDNEETFKMETDTKEDEV